MLTLRLDQGSRLNQGKARLGQGMAMDWSDDGRWTGTHAVRQAEPGHGTAVATAVLGSGTRSARAAVQGAKRRGALLGLTTGHLWRLGGGGGGDRPKTRCVKYTPMCASARVAPSNIVYSWYGYQSTGTGVLTAEVLLFRQYPNK